MNVVLYHTHDDFMADNPAMEEEWSDFANFITWWDLSDESLQYQWYVIKEEKR